MGGKASANPTMDVSPMMTAREVAFAVGALIAFTLLLLIATRAFF